MAKTFIISDESVLSRDVIIDIHGINTEHFLKNPIMLYQHNRGDVIGKWENLRVIGTQMLADAVFDTKSPLGAEIERKVNEGYLRSCSIGVSNMKIMDIGGVDHVLECDLMEVSIVDIPANKNALITENERKGITCFAFESKDFKTQITDLLNLPNNTSEDEILEALKKVIKTDSDKIQNAYRHGYIAKDQIKAFTLVAKTDPKAFSEYINGKEAENKRKIKELTDTAIKEGKFIIYERSLYETIGEEVGLATYKKLLSSLPGQRKITDLLPGGKEHNRKNWGIAQYKKWNIHRLNEESGLYDMLKGIEEPEEFTLEWYRKTSPMNLKTTLCYMKGFYNKKERNDSNRNGCEKVDKNLTNTGQYARKRNSKSHAGEKNR